MKFNVTAVAMTRSTRRQLGNLRTELIDTETNQLFAGMTQPQVIQRRHEAFWNDLNPQSTEIVKVIGVQSLG